MKTSTTKVLAALIRPLIVATVFALPIAAQAANGTWIDLNSNDWSNANTASWSGGIIADGSGNTANFSTINLPTDIFVNVVDARTIGNMTFGDTEIATTPASWSLSGANITLAGGTPTITVGTLGDTKTVSIANVLTGTAGLTKTGSGTLALTGANTFTGGVTISGGTLDTSLNNTILAKQQVTLTNGGTWKYLGAVVGSITGWGMRTSGTTQPPAFDATVGSLWVPAGQTGTLAAGASTVAIGQVGGGAGSTLNVVIPDAGTFYATGSWQTNAPGASNTGGNLGKINLSVGGAGGTARYIFATQTATTGLINNVDRYGTASLGSTELNIGAGVTVFTRSPSGGLQGTGNANSVQLGALSGASTAVLGGAGGSNGPVVNYTIGNLNTNTEYAGTITSENVVSFGSSTVPNPGSTNITKIGTGTLTLSGTLSYTTNNTGTGKNPNLRGGITTISAGTIALRNGATFAGGTEAISPTTIDIRSGATLDVGTSNTYQTVDMQQFIGPGNIVGNFNFAAGVLAPGNTINTPTTGGITGVISNNAVAGTMNIGNFSVNGAGTIRFDLASTPASGNDLIQVTGGDMTGTPTLALNFLGAPAPGVYSIVNSTNALTGSVAGWTVGFSGRGSAPTLSFSGDQKQVLLTIGAGSFGNVNWQGGADGTTWDTQTTANWHNTSPTATNPDKFFSSDTVNFLDTYDGVTAPASTSVTVNTAVTPLAVNVNATANYTIGGTGSIAGSGVVLTKSGTGTLNLQTANTYTGGTVVNGGTINLGSTGTLGTGPLTLNNGAVTAQTTATTNTLPAISLAASSNNTLTLNGGTTHTLGSISGSGNLTIASDSSGKAVDTNGTNTATGTVTVSGPLVRVGGTGGAATAGNTIHWALTGTGTISSGSGSTQALGSLEGDGGTLKGFTGGSTAVAKTWDIGSLDGVGVERVFGGQIIDGTGTNNSTAATNIIKSGEGTWTLTGSNSFRGTTVVNAGVLKIKNATALQNSALTPGGAGVVFDSSVDPHLFLVGGLNGSVDLPLVDNGGNPLNLTVGGTSQNISSTYNGVLSGNGASLTKQGTGTFTLGGNNTYSGATTINNGTLRIGAADRISNSSSLTLNGGTFGTQGFNETLGTLIVNGGTIDLGNGASQLHFADSHLQPWGGGLTINNYSLADGVFVGTNASGLDSNQLSLVTFTGFNPGAVISSTGQLNPAGPAITTLGDVNRDGVITKEDVGAMLKALTDLPAYQANYFLTAQDVKNIADINFDGVVNNFDIQAQLNLVGNLGLGSVSAVPEPASFALLALGGVVLFAARRKRA